MSNALPTLRSLPMDRLPTHPRSIRETRLWLTPAASARSRWRHAFRMRTSRTIRPTRWSSTVGRMRSGAYLAVIRGRRAGSGHIGPHRATSGHIGPHPALARPVAPVKLAFSRPETHTAGSMSRRRQNRGPALSSMHRTMTWRLFGGAERWLTPPSGEYEPSQYCMPKRCHRAGGIRHRCPARSDCGG